MTGHFHGLRTSVYLLWRHVSLSPLPIFLFSLSILKATLPVVVAMRFSELFTDCGYGLIITCIRTSKFVEKLNFFILCIFMTFRKTPHMYAIGRRPDRGVWGNPVSVSARTKAGRQDQVMVSGSMYVSQVWGQVRLGHFVAPTGRCENHDGVKDRPG